MRFLPAERTSSVQYTVNRNDKQDQNLNQTFICAFCAFLWLKSIAVCDRLWPNMSRDVQGIDLMNNWTQVRAKFPVTKRSVYLNTAAAGPLAVTTAKAGAAYYEQMRDDGDVHWDEWLAGCEEVRARVAAFINAEPDEIGFTTNTSSGMNVIVDALEKHGEVISCDLEFPVTTIPWMHRRIPVHLIKSVNGVVRAEDLRAAMNTRTGIVSLSYVQFSNGFRSDLEELATIKGAHALVVNASQAAGVFDIDV